MRENEEKNGWRNEGKIEWKNGEKWEKNERKWGKKWIKMRKWGKKWINMRKNEENTE